jgi:hypothetical protein
VAEASKGSNNNKPPVKPIKAILKATVAAYLKGCSFPKILSATATFVAFV